MEIFFIGCVWPFKQIIQNLSLLTYQLMLQFKLHFADEDCFVEERFHSINSLQSKLFTKYINCSKYVYISWSIEDGNEDTWENAIDNKKSENNEIDWKIVDEWLEERGYQRDKLWSDAPSNHGVARDAWNKNILYQINDPCGMCYYKGVRSC